MDSKLIYSELINKLNGFSDREKKNIALKYLFLRFNISTTDLLINKKISFDEHHKEMFENDLIKINNKTPVQYVTESEYFYDRVFHVNKNTLIPRPETEELVSIVIRSEKSNSIKNILDIGTGSGCIAISIANHLHSNVTGIDSSKSAISVANKNNELSLNKVSFIHSKIEDFIPQKKFDVIVSNPPYIPISDINLVESLVIKHEPHLALFVENDPIYFYRLILDFSQNHLNPNGSIYFEINQKYIYLLKNLLKGFSFELLKDLYGVDRFIKIKTPV